MGRSSQCGVTLEDGLVSRVHAQIVARNGGYYLADNGGANGTTVGGVRVSGEVALADGSEIRLGDTVLRFNMPT